MSGSSFDLPARKNVLQIDLPTSTTTTTNYSYNAATGKSPNLRASLHGIETVQNRVLHGRFTEVEESNPAITNAIQDTLNIAQKVEQTAAKLAGEIVADPTKIILPIHTTNKRDSTSINLPLK
jgi:hypothetical protein